MGYLIDLHVHTYCGSMLFTHEEALLQGIKQNLHGIAFTEHSHYERSEPVERLREQYSPRIRIFRGVELSAREGHCLVFGVDTDRLGIDNAPLADVVRVVAERGGVVIPAHPYRRGQGMGDVVRTVGGLCALEGCNGTNLRAFNEQATTVAGELGLPHTGGSDAHDLGAIGSCTTEFDSPVDEGALVERLRQGGYRGIDTRKGSRFLSFFKS